MIEIKFNDNKTIFSQYGNTDGLIVIKYDHDKQLADISINQTKEYYFNKLSLWQKLCYLIRYFYTLCACRNKIVLNNKQLVELKTFLGSLGP